MLPSSATTSPMMTTPSSSPFAPHWSLYPRTYVAPYTTSPPASIDGNPNKPPWSTIPWSAPFDEIRGPADAPPDTRPNNATCMTRMKMCWDETYLYVLATIESDMEVVAEFTERNSPIFQKDSDFEVFVDPAGCCHSYKELELNAVNTVWNLLLDRPYGDGGSEHSGRIAKPGDDHYYDVTRQQTATKILSGNINEHPTKPGSRTVWSVELALAHTDTLSSDPWGRPPEIGSAWRINFSRVEKRGEINWTWQPQRVWDPLERRVRGFVDMHRPDAWGYVVFGGEDRSKGGEEEAAEGGAMSVSAARDPTWPARLAAMNVYYAQAVHAERNNGAYAPDLAALGDLVDDAIINPFLEDHGGGGIRIALSGGTKGYVATVVGTDGKVVSVTNNRLLTVGGSRSTIGGVRESEEQ